MKAARSLALALVLSLASAPLARSDGAVPDAVPDASSLYREYCARCHGERRYGGYAPPLLATTLERKPDAALKAAIREGLANTQMPAFGDRIDDAQAAGLVAWLREATPPVHWSTGDIAASRVELPAAPPRIPAAVRRENLILVVERGTGHVAVLDGDRMQELDRFPVGRLHGGIKFDAALRRAFAVTRDGTLVRYDLTHGGLYATAKVGVNTRNIALSPDGGLVAAANQLPQGLVVLDGELRPLASLDLPGQPSAVYQLPGAPRFLVALRDVARLYSVEQPGLELTWSELPEPFEDFVFVPDSTRLVASSRGGSRLLLYDWASHEVIASLATQGLPHLFSACFFSRGERLYAAFNHVGAARLSVIDMQSFRVEREIALRGSGYFVRTHPGTPYLWVDTNTSEIQLVSKDTLSLLERSLSPEPGKKAMHVEFTAEGDRALVSVWDDAGAVVIYDARSLEERGRLPFAMPVGKYNTANKTRALD